MDGDQEAILRRIVRENQEARARFQGLAARTSSAVVAGDWDEFQTIIKEASNDGDNESSEPDPTGVDAAQGPASSPQ